MDGREIQLDAIFVASEAHPHDDLVAHFDLDRASTPMGSFLATDMTGKTSHPRIWAVGNVSNPGATVPVSMSAGALAGGMVNMALVNEDFDRAVRRGGSNGSTSAPAPVGAVTSPAEHWEGEYSQGRVRWSGNVNAATATVVSTLEPGPVLELGSGEGGHAVWFAEQGWQVTAVDISPTATARGAEAAADRGVAESIEWVAHDLSAWETDKHFDLVTASFFHSNVELQRLEILRRSADRLRPGGHLLLVTHVFETADDIPPWGRKAAQDHAHHHGRGGHGRGRQGRGGEAKSQGHSAHTMPTPTEELEQLAFDPAYWEVVREEIRPREITSPDGTQTAAVKDGVLLLRRRG